MECYDLLLIYRNPMSRYTATGRVWTMAQTEHVRNEYWDGGPTLDIYVVEGYDDSLDVESETVNRLLGYEESFWPQGLWRVSDDRPTKQVLWKFGI